MTDMIPTLRKFLRARGMSFLQDQNVTSVGIGYKNGDRSLGPCLQFSVSQKAGDSQLESLNTQPIPKSFSFEGVDLPTDVLERNYQPTFRLVVSEDINYEDVRRSRQETVAPGMSVCHVAGTAGTLGAIVYDQTTGQPLALSNWHVFHGGEGQIGDQVVQPGPYDNNNIAGNGMGKLLRSHLGVAGDCAIASLEQRDFDEAIVELGVRPKRMAEVDLDDKVVKSGRTTGVTHGVITRTDMMIRMNYPGHSNVMINGFEIGIDQDYLDDVGLSAATYEVSMGGDSGSVWMIKDDEVPTDIAVGLHFAGEAGGNIREFALACYIHKVVKKLNVGFTPPEVHTPPPVDDTVDDPEPTERHLGFKSKFLGESMPTPYPTLTGTRKDDLLEVDGKSRFHYTHFSLAMSKSRRLALYTACNIDGANMVRVSRSGGWDIDPRIGAENQLDNRYYKNNPYDRGHLVRRLDPCWGTPAVASKASSDTFVYSNAAPQRDDFNQEEWLQLEDWVLSRARQDNYKLSVYTGPVFADSDDFLLDAQIPASFWKVIAFQKAEGEFRTLAFLLNQFDHIESGRPRIRLGMFQVPIEQIEGLTGLDFGNLKEVQPGVITERLAATESLEKAPAFIVSAIDHIQF